jgi:hypothetical protein
MSTPQCEHWADWAADRTWMRNDSTRQRLRRVAPSRFRWPKVHNRWRRQPVHRHVEPVARAVMSAGDDDDRGPLAPSAEVSHTHVIHVSGIGAAGLG